MTKLSKFLRQAKGLLCLLCALGYFPANADTLVIGLGQQGQERSIDLPTRGQTSAEVIQSFGEPKSRTTPVGTPPISTWHYTDFSVYFEKDYVIHAVVKHIPQSQDLAPQP